ncbi:Ppx/GppA phosphatase family protein [Halonatronum saccharophilum]|uniref:Ppx/GppA phosphatase family protein n=1 Tax=Halonatronum saccharophilum TaxID=150060 RepID=UPI000481B917|nr:Ppx/GppA phosphatase family protein [Halonatronum saccharophilum]
MAIGAIDIGTNSVRLLVGHKNDDKVKTLEAKLRTPRLGEGVDKTKILNGKAIKRTIDVLKEYKNIIKNYNGEIYAVATSAVRSAKNKDQFLKSVKEEVGIEIDIVSGEEEARLSYLGLLSSFDNDFQGSLTIDIGGGSTEFIFANKDRVENYFSIDLGALRLTESYGGDLDNIFKEVKKSLKNINIYKEVKTLFGVGGTVTTLAAIEKKLEAYNKDIVHGTILDKESIEKIFNRLSSLSPKERVKVKGLTPKRADIILGGIIILLGIMERFKVGNLKVSDAGILEGIIYDKD